MKEKVKDFSQIFITLLKNIPDKPVEEVQIYYRLAATSCHVCKEEINTDIGIEFCGSHQS